MNRRAALVTMDGHLEEDRDGYRQLAENLVKNGTYGWYAENPTAYRPPLYPLSLKKCIDSTGQLSLLRVALFHVALGVATVMLTIDLGRRWGLGRWSVAAGRKSFCGNGLDA